MTSHGYVKVRVGLGHPLADPNGYAYEHTLVWITAGYAAPVGSQAIHHRNGDKVDNRIENLELLSFQEHMHRYVVMRRNQRPELLERIHA